MFLGEEDKKGVEKQDMQTTHERYRPKMKENVLEELFLPRSWCAFDAGWHFRFPYMSFTFLF